MDAQFVSRSSKSLDPLSQILSVLVPHGYMTGGVDAGGQWAIHFQQDQIFRCFAILSGHCWLSLEGRADSISVAAGDVVILPHGRPFRLGNNFEIVPVDIMSVIRTPLNGRIETWQGGGSCLALSALFTFSGDPVRWLLSALPPFVHIHEEPDKAAVRWYLERMMTMLREPQPGGFLLGEHLAQMLLIEVLRLHAADQVASSGGWLSALSDRQIGKAIAAMHQQPAHRWTLRHLGELAGMSRSAFALRFKEKVGISAIEYLIRWRMTLAGDRLLHSVEPVGAIAAWLGYQSESAFAFAFKREMGCSPRQYCRQHAPVSRYVSIPNSGSLIEA
jgi:AraC-like DNA-binding protein/mannose-6-phosphate isomerase-like protein (cupin superfamily)